MSLIIDNSSFSTLSSSGTSKSFSYTVGSSGSNTGLFASASLRAQSGTVPPNTITATYNGVSMTKIGEHTYNGTTADILVAFFYLASPATGANTLAFSWTVSSIGAFAPISFYGVSKSSPWRSGSYTTLAGTNSGTLSINVPSNAGDYVLDVVSCEGYGGGAPANLEEDASQTQIMDGEVAVTNRMAYGASYKSGASPTLSMVWTKDGGLYAIMAGISVQPANRSTGVVVSPMMRF